MLHIITNASHNSKNIDKCDRNATGLNIMPETLSKNAHDDKASKICSIVIIINFILALSIFIAYISMAKKLHISDSLAITIILLCIINIITILYLLVHIYKKTSKKHNNLLGKIDADVKNTRENLAQYVDKVIGTIKTYNQELDIYNWRHSQVLIDPELSSFESQKIAITLIKEEIKTLLQIRSTAYRIGLENCMSNIIKYFRHMHSYDEKLSCLISLMINIHYAEKIITMVGSNDIQNFKSSENIIYKLTILEKEIFLCKIESIESLYNSLLAIEANLSESLAHLKENHIANSSIIGKLIKVNPDLLAILPKALRSAIEEKTPYEFVSTNLSKDKVLIFKRARPLDLHVNKINPGFLYELLFRVELILVSYGAKVNYDCSLNLDSLRYNRELTNVDMSLINDCMRLIINNSAVGLGSKEQKEVELSMILLDSIIKSVDNMLNMQYGAYHAT